jgi:hypothetical protein
MMIEFDAPVPRRCGGVTHRSPWMGPAAASTWWDCTTLTRRDTCTSPVTSWSPPAKNQTIIRISNGPLVLTSWQCQTVICYGHHIASSIPCLSVHWQQQLTQTVLAQCSTNHRCLPPFPLSHSEVYTHENDVNWQDTRFSRRWNCRLQPSGL